jgi:hypothetical protein
MYLYMCVSKHLRRQYKLSKKSFIEQALVDTKMSIIRFNTFHWKERLSLNTLIQRHISSHQEVILKNKNIFKTPPSIFVEFFQPSLLFQSWNANWTFDLLIKVAYFVINVCIIKSSWFKLVSTRRSTVPSLPLQ